MHLQSLKLLRLKVLDEKHLQKKTFGSRSHEMLPSSLYIMWPIQLQSLKLLPLTV